MNHSGIDKIIAENNVRSERTIAVVQSCMAFMVFGLHLVIFKPDGMSSLSGYTLLIVLGIMGAGAIRVFLAGFEKFPTAALHFLTVIDGALIFGLLFSYNFAFGLEMAAAFKSPTIVLFAVFSCIRVLKLDYLSIFITGGTVLIGWFILHLVAYLNGSTFTSSYTEFISSNSILIAASIEVSIGYLCIILSLTYFIYIARKFGTRITLVEELEAANQVAQENSHQIKEIIGSSSEGIVILGTDGIIEQANTTMASIFGYKRGSMIGTSIYDLMPGEFSETVKDAIVSYDSFGISNVFGKWIETRGIKRSGEYMPLRAFIKPSIKSGEVAFTAFVTDISEQKQLEKSKQMLLLKYESVLNMNTDALILFDGDGVIERINLAAEEMFGLVGKNVAGRSLDDQGLLNQSHYLQGLDHRELLAKCRSGNGNGFEMEMADPDGNDIRLELSIWEIAIDEGELFLLSIRERCKTAASSMNNVNKNQEVETKAALEGHNLTIMNHEIRTPLSGILGILDMLAESDLEDEQLYMLETARTAGQSLLGIVNDTLDISRVKAGKLTLYNNPFDIGELLASVVRLIKPQADQKNLSLEYSNLLVGRGIFKGDADRLRQVLVNLVWNAVKFTEIGKVEIRVSENEKGTVLFEVEDTGVGIPKESRNDLFQEFSTLENHNSGKSTGTGLGLVICKSIVQAMNGSIDVESEEGKGSRFWFSIPLERSLECHLHAAPKMYRPNIGEELTGKKILVAEDNPVNQFIITRWLKELGCIIELAHDGIEVVELFEHGHHDLVLMDISMPGMNGYEATQAIRDSGQYNANLPILAFTAYADGEIRDQMLASGMNGVVVKPYSKTQLLEALLPYLEGETDQCQSTGRQKAHGLKLDGFDMQTVASVFEGQDHDSCTELLNHFAHDISTSSHSIEESLKDRDWERVEKASHSLRSSSGMLGAYRLAEMAETINAQCRQGNMEEGIDLALELLSEAKQIINRVKNSSQDGLPEFVKQAMVERRS